MKSIKFIPELIEAIISGQKTQTRRPLEPQPSHGYTGMGLKKGDSFVFIGNTPGELEYFEPKYLKGEVVGLLHNTRRIFLKITNVWVERLHNISYNEAFAEGVKDEFGLFKDYLNSKNLWSSAIISFSTLWQSIYGENAWNDNPWVFTYEFVRCDKNGKELEV